VIEETSKFLVKKGEYAKHRGISSADPFTLPSYGSGSACSSFVDTEAERVTAHPQYITDTTLVDTPNMAGA